jgi:hypothetical protein
MMQRVHKAKRDYGITDYYKFYTKNNKITKDIYSKIITEYNNEIINLIIEDNMIYQIPFLGFEIVIKKDKRKPKIVNGKLISNIPIDFKATKELWASNPECKEKKLLVRHNNSHSSGYVFRIYCKKFKSQLKNRSLLKFKPNRKFQRQLSARIKDENKDNFDAFLLYQK